MKTVEFIGKRNYKGVSFSLYRGKGFAVASNRDFSFSAKEELQAASLARKHIEEKLNVRL